MPAPRELRPLLVHPQARSDVLSVRAKALVFADPVSSNLLHKLEPFARSDASVLLMGETGTGKELLAHHLHRESGRAGRLVAVNCGALPQSLAEAEFFGHQAGAFTGATATRAGWFEEAHGGTLFLDEIGDLPVALQSLLLRVLQEREVVRVGSRRSIAVDFRLIAATNIDLQKAVAAGTFRRDLYYRLSVAAFHVPPLRERAADILPLAEHFLDQYSQRLSVPRPLLAPETTQALLGYAWPGNIREVENVIHAAVLTAKHGTITPADLRFHPVDASHAASSGDAWSDLAAAIDRLLALREPDLHARCVQLLVRQAYLQAGSNQVKTAERLGVTRNVVRTLLGYAGLLGSSS